MYMRNMPNNNTRHNCYSCNNENDMIENACEFTPNYLEMNGFDNMCQCGFKEENNVFPSNYMYAQSYVPWQIMQSTFKPCAGLKMGTIFPELVSPYMPGQSMQEIEYLSQNKIGGECNK